MIFIEYQCPCCKSGLKKDADLNIHQCPYCGIQIGVKKIGKTVYIKNMGRKWRNMVDENIANGEKDIFKPILNLLSLSELTQELNDLIAIENYEQCAKIRDEINRRKCLESK